MQIGRIIRSSFVGGISNWSSLLQLGFAAITFCGGGALLSWAVSTIEPIMRYGWGAVILAGIAVACGIALTLSVAAFAIRAFFPTKYSPYQMGADSLGEQPGKDEHIKSIVSDMTAIKEVVRSHYEDFDKRFGFASQKIGQSLEKLKEIDCLLAPSKVPTLLEALGTNIGPAANRFESLENNIKIAADRLKYIEDSVAERFENLISKIERLNEDSFDTFKRVQKVFHFERVLESYKSMSKDIDELAEKMDDPLSKSSLYSDWANWSADFLLFKSQLTNLDRFLTNHSEIRLNIFDTPPERYSTNNWSYDFKDMSDDQKMDYKTYGIIYTNFLSKKAEIESKLYNATFLKI